jgi:uncharacterized protein YbjQ (UPF0145 family)
MAAEKYVFYCPQCKTIFRYDDITPKICGSCGKDNTIYTGYRENDWYRLSKEERDALVQKGTATALNSSGKAAKEEKQVEETKIYECMQNMLLTTTNGFEGYRIIRYCDVIYDEIIVGFGFFKSCIASFDNFGAAIAGAEATQTTERLESIKNSLRNRVKEKAVKMGANALVGIDFEQSGMGDLIMVSMTATAVSIEKNEEKISEEQCFQKNV